MESDCNRVLRELLGSAWYWGVWGGGLLGGTRDTGGTVGYCWVLGVLEGYWVLEVLGVLQGNRGY